jgi:LppP/LprE lipoprotein
MMRPHHPVMLLLAGALAAAAAGCGSSRPSAASAPETITVTTRQTTTLPATAPPTAAATTQATSVTAPPSASGTSSVATRTEGGGPAFAGPPPASPPASAAAAVLQAHGFVASDPSQYHPDQTLQVLVGMRAGSGDGRHQQAFFFVDGRYIGTDSSAPSASIGVVSQSDTDVTLSYGLYRSGDPLCCPSGGRRNVTFELDNGHLTPLSAIPPQSARL